LASHSTISVSGSRPPYPWPRRKRQADCNLTGALITTKHIQGGSIGLSNNFLREQCVRRGAWGSYNGTGKPIVVFLYVSERGAPLSAPGFSRMIERAVTAADLGITAHARMLRYAYGYKLANDGHTPEQSRLISVIARFRIRRAISRWRRSELRVIIDKTYPFCHNFRRSGLPRKWTRQRESRRYDEVTTCLASVAATDASDRSSTSQTCAKDSASIAGASMMLTGRTTLFSAPSPCCCQSCCRRG
jgi:hypothetical protein